MSSNPEDDKLFRRYHPTRGWLMPLSEHQITHERLTRYIQDLEKRLDRINKLANCFQYAPLDSMRTAMREIADQAEGMKSAK